jgi:hypothetical protein
MAMALKKPTPIQKGLKKLPTTVRNKMGYMKKGGSVKKKSGSKPSNPSLYSKVKSEAKRKFKVYPSAYANAWLVKTYKSRGGGYA